MYICKVFNNRVETVMFKDICPYGLGGSTLLTDMGFFYGMKNTGHIVRSRKTAKDRYTMILNDIVQSRELTPEEKTILIYYSRLIKFYHW